jgi:hypothetical protein
MRKEKLFLGYLFLLIILDLPRLALLGWRLVELAATRHFI